MLCLLLQAHDKLVNLILHLDSGIWTETNRFLLSRVMLQAVRLCMCGMSKHIWYFIWYVAELRIQTAVSHIAHTMEHGTCTHCMGLPQLCKLRLSTLSSQLSTSDSQLSLLE